MLNFKKVNHEIAEDVKKMLRLQGHYLTGELERSFEELILTAENHISLIATSKKYGEYLEDGVPANKIPYNPGSGAKSSKYISALQQYVKLRMGISEDKKALSIAFAIAKKHKAEGMGTKKSIEHSSTGKRIEAIKDTFVNNDNRYGQMIDKEVVSGIDDVFNLIKSGTI